MALSLFRGGPAFGEAGVFCNSESENSSFGTESWRDAAKTASQFLLRGSPTVKFFNKILLLV